MWSSYTGSIWGLEGRWARKEKECVGLGGSRGVPHFQPTDNNILVSLTMCANCGVM